MEFSDKYCVKVRADHNTDGTVQPLKIKWIDDAGQEYIVAVNRVLDVCPGASLKVGVAGTRYTIQVGTKVFQLYYAEKKWYLESSAQ